MRCAHANREKETLKQGRGRRGCESRNEAVAKGGQGDVGEEGEENSELILFEYSVIKPHTGHVNLIFLIKRENIQS